MPRAKKPAEAQSKTEIWKQFQKAVKALAVQMGISEKRFELSLVRERSGKKSDAWKNHERKTAEAFQKAGFSKSYRVLRGDDIGVSDIDVRIPEAPNVMVDCKYRQDGWTHHSIFMECEKKYCTSKDDFLILPTKSGNETGALATIRLEVLAMLLASKFLNSERPLHTLGCPRCSSTVSETNIKKTSLGLAECLCSNCFLGYLIKEEELPLVPTLDKTVKPKTKKPVTRRRTA